MKSTFREQAQIAAEREDFVEALRLYLAALRESPDDVTLHQELRDVGLQFKAAGGKSLGLIAKVRAKMARSPKRKLLDAANILARDPGDLDAMIDLMESAQTANFTEVAEWASRLLRAAEDASR
jgi:hypothetical protein